MSIAMLYLIGAIDCGCLPAFLKMLSDAPWLLSQIALSGCSFSLVALSGSVSVEEPVSYLLKGWKGLECQAHMLWGHDRGSVGWLLR